MVNSLSEPSERDALFLQRLREMPFADVMRLGREDLEREKILRERHPYRHSDQSYLTFEELGLFYS